MVVTLPIDQRTRSCRGADGANAANEDGVIMARKHFRNLAIKRGEGILENRRTGQHGRPSRAGISGRSFKTVSSGKPVRKCALFIAQQGYAEIGMTLKRAPGSRTLGDTNQESWRMRRQ
jgi:hypothetical protein